MSILEQKAQISRLKKDEAAFPPTCLKPGASMPLGMVKRLTSDGDIERRAAVAGAVFGPRLIHAGGRERAPSTGDIPPHRPSSRSAPAAHLLL